MSTCDTCKWWTREDNTPSELLHRVCGNRKLSGPSWMSDYTGYDNDSLIQEHDNGGFYLTGPKFGCVHHFPCASP